MADVSTRSGAGLAVPSHHPAGLVRSAVLLLGLALVAFALLMPSSWLARSAVPLSNSPLSPFAGVQFFRGALLLNAVLLFLWWLDSHRSRGVKLARAAPRAALDPFERTSPAAYLSLAFLMLLAAVLRFWKLGGGLYFDEIIDLIYYVRGSFADILIRFPGFFPQILSALLAKLSIRALGETPWALRLPEATFGIFSVWAIYWLARLIVGVREALLATLLLATSYHAVFFSQSSRGYSAQVLFTILATAALLRASADNRGRSWAIYGMASVLNIYTQFFSVFVAIGLTLAYVGQAVYQRRTMQNWPAGLRHFLWASMFIASVSLLLYAPMTPGLFFFSRVTAVQRYAGPQLTRGFTQELIGGLQSAYGLIPLVALAALGLLGFVSLIRKSSFGAAALALPLAIGIGAVAVLHVEVHPRFFIYALPAGLITLVRGLAWGAEIFTTALRLREPIGFARWACLGIALIVAALQLVRLAPYYRVPKQDYSGALAFAEQNHKPNEPVVAVGLAAHAYTVYYAPWLPVARSVEDVEKLRESGHRVWLLYTLPGELRDRNPELLKYVQTNFQKIRLFPGTLGNGALVVCRAEPLPTQEK